ncbi:MAG: hypothetical protein KKB20_20845 [Proteobacteria bacterium]|nr:hypothetical protein [Pseudomonadota bacterium]
MTGKSVTAVHFQDLTSGLSYLFYFLVSMTAAGLVAWRVPLRKQGRLKLLSLYGGLFAAPGIIASFSMSEREALLKMIGKPTFEALAEGLDTPRSFHNMAEWLNYVELFGILSIVAGAVALMFKLHPAIQRLRIAVRIGFFLFGAINAPGPAI